MDICPCRPRCKRAKDKDYPRPRWAGQFKTKSGHEEETQMSRLSFGRPSFPNVQKMTLEENAGRMDLFIERTIKTGGLKTFVKSLSSRPDKAYARAVLQKVRQHARIDVEDLL